MSDECVQSTHLCSLHNATPLKLEVCRTWRLSRASVQTDLGLCAAIEGVSENFAQQ